MLKTNTIFNLNNTTQLPTGNSKTDMNMVCLVTEHRKLHLKLRTQIMTPPTGKSVQRERKLWDQWDIHTL